ncbi:UDP-N-acetylmuramate--L-alanine ligase [Natronogracilivirga saccharolytica]|uniref:UDP-N-acetylmuramate--L-alanine ligase n=1 Tax=Natronogracilivirga saccharolytica TaxID=2812953 RepID=A0A8J7UW85_9BACT|nr:UDP-N-acetylmuramate--L-alanine ligase [Natronogracilivirga saccharolytica]MBP3193396.1 UDP-N-acetylmuramate--L-alanine ligase [Natronogracilivirga saccharolytica]
MTRPVQTQPVFGNTKHIHMVGIGGIGMSGMAEILLHRGFTVSGSDGSKSETTRRLEKLGARVHIGHDPAHIEGADVVVYTSAVTAEENEETAAALEKGVPVIKRAEMLAELMRMKYGIGIAGTHGKTTATTMTGLVVQAGSFDPTIIVGGRVHSFDKTNAVVGKGDIVIVEADEFDRTFLRLSPSLAVITNIDIEHMDIYQDEDDIKNAFVEFANKVPFYGAVVLCLDDQRLQSIIPDIERRIITYGFTPQARLRPASITSSHIKSSFDVLFDDEHLGHIDIDAPGDHNIRNALSAIGIGLELGMSFDDIRKGLARYSGVFRRFQVKYDSNDILVVDDYAHHPTEVKATLAAARKGWPERRIIAVFQPHLYSRTLQQHKEFGSSFFDAEKLILTDVYPAREAPIEGVSGKLIADTARAYGHRDVRYVPDTADLAGELGRVAEPGDMIITMGAGDIYKYGEAFVRSLTSTKTETS